MFVHGLERDCVERLVAELWLTFKTSVAGLSRLDVLCSWWCRCSWSDPSDSTSTATDPPVPKSWWWRWGWCAQCEDFELVDCSLCLQWPRHGCCCGVPSFESTSSRIWPGRAGVQCQRSIHAGAYVSHRRAHERHVFVDLEDASAVCCVPVHCALPFVHLAWRPELSSWSGSIPFANGEVCSDCYAKWLPARSASNCAEAFAGLSEEAKEMAPKLPGSLGRSFGYFADCAGDACPRDAGEGGTHGPQKKTKQSEKKGFCSYQFGSLKTTPKSGVAKLPQLQTPFKHGFRLPFW